MAQAKAKKSATKDSRPEAFKAEEILQAVVIADSFNERFKPLTLQTPRALVPVCNCPTIEFTLDFLAGNGVSEIFIFCRANAEKIRKFIESHWKWGPMGRRHRSVSVQIIMSEDCYSMGDALREIDAKNTIRGDFILVQGDLIANVDIKPALDAHRKRKTLDKNSIMTVVCRQVASRHPARSQEDQVVLAIEPLTNRVLHFQKLGTAKKVSFPVDIFEGRDELEFRTDLIDCHISICSASVPPLFSDNFDYLTRDDFIRGILVNEEVLGNTIYCHLLTAGYTARISNLHMYDVVSRDIIARWVYPYCADLGFPEGDAYFYRRHHIYLQKDVELKMGCVLEANVLVGRQSVIGENTRIRNSVIGNGCTIGRDCKIEGSYIWGNCVIQDGCELYKCIIADGCVVYSGSVIESGCILSYGVKVGPDALLSAGSRLFGEADLQILLQENSEDGDVTPKDRTFATVDEKVRGSSGSQSWLFTLNEIEDEEEDIAPGGINYEKLSWKWTSVENLDDSWEEDSESSDSDGDSVDDVDGPKTTGAQEDIKVFFHEISDSLLRAVDEKVNPDNVILEINSSKFAYNVTMTELNKLVVRAIIEIPELKSLKQRTELKSVKDASAQIVSAFETLLPVLRNYYRSSESQMDALLAIEECAVNYLDLPRHQPYGNLVISCCLNILHFLYNNDILTEDVIRKWYAEPEKAQVRRFLPFFLHEQQQHSPAGRRRHISGDLSDDEVSGLVKKAELLKQKIAPFIHWLEEAEEESD
ncbi:translation initiation factor eIF-2B subunit epsilon-like [Paramacrobiotus metropolitanus]|uniref:translation initiation factor eIF-2B subunit epsilon-like n=1 Tax=Paramacrobiotus metropolitanus TaxID=2943436 RepID=UPI002445D100|nr:translation initiation factor eIF-2B subunit epsilon-like [Paramacrobiotus metropolitanus]